MSVEGKSILLGVTGGIAAYKAADLCSRLGKLGAEVHVVLTEHAARFVGAATFRALTRMPVITDLFDEPHARRIAHIDLAQSADLVLVAPASANAIARMAHGLADDMLTTCLLATPPATPLLIAPAMNTVMWEHPATQANLAMLQQRGVEVVSPAYGLLACQDVGYGKLADVGDIVCAVERRLSPRRDFDGKRVLITAGATREPLDPVRFLSNRSSGKMGFALAEEARSRGAQVTVVAGFTTAAPPAGVDLVRVGSAREMLAACQAASAGCDVVIGAAAVADYAPETPAAEKIKKSSVGSNVLTIRLAPTPDVIAALAAERTDGQIFIGFAAETSELAKHAAEKLRTKRLDLLVANDVSGAGAGFDADTNAVTLLWPDGRCADVPLAPKREVAARVLDAAAALLVSKGD